MNFLKLPLLARVSSIKYYYSVKAKYLVFLDIDGTLLRPDYKPNSGQVPQLIKKLSRKGYLFCLNSNRALEDILPIARQFAINGPVIAENGVFFLFNGKKFFLVKPQPIRDKVRSELKKLALRENAYFSMENTVAYDWKKASKIPLAWIANGFRLYTASIHVRTLGKQNGNAARRLAGFLAKRFAGDFAVSISPIFANVLISPKNTGKGAAIRLLQKKFFAGIPVIMIGDDEADIPASKTADAFYTVGNAAAKIKKIADFTAQKTYTQGVVEILRHIDKNPLSM